jgi:transposase
LAANVEAPARERLTLIRIFEELRALGYDGGYDAIRRYARSWAKTNASATADAFVPLTFAPGEAYQFDWSHEIVVMDGVTTIVKVAHLRLCHSRMMFVRVYPRETQEMVFDAHERAFAFFKGACARGIYDNLWTSPAQGDPLGSAAGMHESIRPVAGQLCVPGLDGSPLLLAS